MGSIANSHTLLHGVISNAKKYRTEKCICIYRTEKCTCIWEKNVYVYERKMYMYMREQKNVYVYERTEKCICIWENAPMKLEIHKQNY